MQMVQYDSFRNNLSATFHTVIADTLFQTHVTRTRTHFQLVSNFKHTSFRYLLTDVLNQHLVSTGDMARHSSYEHAIINIDLTCWLRQSGSQLD